MEQWGMEQLKGAFNTKDYSIVRKSHCGVVRSFVSVYKGTDKSIQKALEDSNNEISEVDIETGSDGYYVLGNGLFIAFTVLIALGSIYLYIEEPEIGAPLFWLSISMSVLGCCCFSKSCPVGSKANKIYQRGLEGVGTLKLNTEIRLEKIRLLSYNNPQYNVNSKDVVPASELENNNDKQPLIPVQQQDYHQATTDTEQSSLTK